MSMLSTQCDKLRVLATRYDELQVGAVKAVTMPSDMGSVLREAADTIWELRNKCADLMDERETAERNRTRNAREYARLCHENAKLREMASALRQCLEWESCKGCPMQDDAGWCVRDVRLRELGVEVDE